MKPTVAKLIREGSGQMMCGINGPDVHAVDSVVVDW